MSASELNQRDQSALLFASTTDDGTSGKTRWSHKLRHTVRLVSTSWLASAILHVLVLFAIGRIFLPLLPPAPIQELVMGEATLPIEELEDFHELSIETEATDAIESAAPDMPMDAELIIVEPELTLPAEDAQLAISESPRDLTEMVGELAAADAAGSGSAVAGRGDMSATELLHAGGNAGSEAAVRESLVWLARHQLPDGGWSLLHGQLPGCDCRNSGAKLDDATKQLSVFESRFAATGLALLPFLGAGQTHLEGKHQQLVKRGLAYLINNLRRTGNRAALRDRGNYYAHGICTIAICEAYAMTRDPALAGPAQELINEIVYAQDPLGGGWRYTPRQPGDTSVTGWQFMALKSAKMGGLTVPVETVEKANAFLNAASQFDGAYAASDCVISQLAPTQVVVTVPPVIDLKTKTVTTPARQVTYDGLDTSQAQLAVGQPLAKGSPIAAYGGAAVELAQWNGWRYRYMRIRDLQDDTSVIAPYRPTPTLTAVGMLCRMYYGWENDNPLLQRTVDYLSQLGPSVAEDGKDPNMYYNYYATQVMRHRASAEQWSAWNEKLRNFLIQAQQTSGHERGSWHFEDQHHGDREGGRLYTTALASMILEVYYRHLPLYRDDAASSFLD